MYAFIKLFKHVSDICIEIEKWIKNQKKIILNYITKAKTK